MHHSHQPNHQAPDHNAPDTSIPDNHTLSNRAFNNSTLNNRAFTDNRLYPTIRQIHRALHSYQGADFLDTAVMAREAGLHHAIALDDIYTGQVSAQAAVLIVLTNEAAPQLLFTRRSARLNSHAGEVSFVGGKKDNSDLNIIAAALREAQEEVGLNPNDVQILDTLPMQLSKAGLLVRPVVGVIAPIHIPTLIPSQAEIARLFWVALAHFLNHAPQDHVFDIRHDVLRHTTAADAPTSLHTPAWCVADEVIWGMTGRILNSLLSVAYDIDYPWYYRLR